MRISGSFSQEPSKETEYVSAVDDTERVGSGFRHLEELWQLLAWAREYHCAAFIQGDPVQFPHRYTQKQDIEVSGLLTAIMSFGNRRQILKKADGLHGLMGASPYRYVLSCRWKEDFLPTDRSSFYRMLSHADFYTYFARLHAAYTRFDSLEDALSVYPPKPRLCSAHSSERMFPYR